MITKYCLWATSAMVLLVIQPEPSESAHILAVHPYASHSHNNLYGPIIKALTRRGHTFTVITSQPVNSPPSNYKQINTSNIFEDHHKVFNSMDKDMGVLRLFAKVMHMTDDICRKTLFHPEVQKLIHPSKSSERFDLILMTNFFGECLYGFSHVYKVPMILLSPAGPFPTTYSAIGTIVLPSAVANPVMGFDDRMTFWQRIINSLSTIGFTVFYKGFVLPNMYSIMKEAFGEDIPDIKELEKYISLAMVNHHFSLNGAHPLGPNLIEIGGIHVNPPKNLPKDLQDFMNGAGEDGVIYFSMGSILRSANFPLETRNAFIAAFSELKQRVLWKWEGENPLPGQTNNVRLEKWLPQQDLLAHPNVKIFITHGGLNSFQEAATRGVPLIGIPFFADQIGNVQRAMNLKVAVKLDCKNLTKLNILNAINEILNDPSYSINMKNIQSIIADQRDHPLDRAVYWIEYVLRNKGAKHLRPAAADLKWYQLYMVDIFFVMIVIPNLALICIGYIILKFIKKRCQSKKKTEDSSKKEQ
ncbi:UDP-glycosyltransferase [Ladona fulva]|uniref:UDP-glycosyltransferase n=1 Tax=Ladona fulva TaxID=123851 RepID=A0A8K0K520_LADFU|nr:UDP-glycosyltransferase [Ladona fulva]